MLRGVQPHVRDKHVQGILNVLGTGSKGLKFTHELPKKSSIKFLKVRFKMSEKHVCWSYRLWSKGMHRYDTTYSKLIKGSIAVNCLWAALAKLCDHFIAKSFQHWLECIERAGFSKELINSVAEVLLQEVRKEGRAHSRSSIRLSLQPVALAYIHCSATN